MDLQNIPDKDNVYILDEYLGTYLSGVKVGVVTSTEPTSFRSRLVQFL